MAIAAESTAPTNGASGQTPLKKVRPRKYLPSARIRASKQLALVRAYGLIYRQTGQPVSNKEAGETAQLTESTAALLNPFLVETGFLARQGQGFVPSEDVLAYAHAFDAETATEKLAPQLLQTWFATVLLPRLRLSPRSEKEALTALAEACGATAEYTEQLGVLLDYLAAAAIIERDGGTIRVGKLGATGDRQSANDQLQPPRTEGGEKPAVGPPGPNSSTVTTHFRSDPAEGVVRFSVSVEVGTSEMSGWEADRIAAFFSGVAQVLHAKGNLEKKQATA